MKNFAIGLLIGMGGFGMWAISSFVAATSDFFNEAQPWFGNPLMIISFLIMLLGPVTYWIVLPVISLVKRKRQR